MDSEYLIDPTISIAKFERELADYRQLEDDYIAKGWFLIKAEFPKVFMVFAVPQIKPPAIAFGAVIDFVNYDFWAPSVQLVDPFTQKPYKAKELPTLLFQNVALPNMPETDMPNPSIPRVVNPQPLMQFYGEEEIPFLCLPGVREYHGNPAHTGDSWLLHRANGEGTLHFILEQLYRYGVQCIKGYEFQIQFRITRFSVEAPT